MIGFFPGLYPDELVYSVLARYVSRAGYAKYRFGAEDLLRKRVNHPSIEFMNAYTDDVYRAFAVQKSMERIILEHTMFPCYGRFLLADRKKKAFSSFINMPGSSKNLVYYPSDGKAAGRFLRYCTLCVADDREKYGETYWHRMHQIPGICVCPVHGCMLYNSSVMISAAASPRLVTAEEEAAPRATVFPDNEQEWNISSYINKVFQSPMAFDNEVDIGRILHSYLIGTQYVSARGEMRDIQLLYTDMKVFYDGVPGYPFTEDWKVKKVLSGKKPDLDSVCLLGLFLRIPPEKLGMMVPGELHQKEKVDAEIRKLRSEGLKFPEIARRTGLSYDYVKTLSYRMTRSGVLDGTDD